MEPDCLGLILALSFMTLGKLLNLSMHQFCFCKIRIIIMITLWDYYEINHMKCILCKCYINVSCFSFFLLLLKHFSEAQTPLQDLPGFLCSDYHVPHWSNSSTLFTLTVEALAINFFHFFQCTLLSFISG